MKIYISGKITGDRRYKAKFREVEKKLAAADAVLFMQDYQDSRGAMLEWAWCQYVGKQTCFDLAAFGGGDNA